MRTFPTRACLVAAVLAAAAGCKDAKPATPQAARAPAAPAAPAAAQGIPSVQQRLAYPPLAKAAGMQGTVVVRAIMDDAGKLVDARVDQKLGAGMDEAAIEAVRAAWDSPDLASLKRQGQPGASGKREVPVPVVFRV